MSVRRSQGFTLLELMTSIAITIIILLAVAAAFTATQTIYQREAHLKGAVENGRIASAYIERVTKMIGYGIDPRFAIDIDPAGLAVGGKSNYVGAASTTTAGMTGFITDDFAFRYRDPAYLRRGTLNAGALTIDTTTGSPATFGVVFPAGRLLQVVCAAGQAWAVVKTTGATLSTASTFATVSAAISGDATSFPAPPGGACFNLTGVNAPYIMLVHEVRLRVIPLGVAPNIRPFLVAYHDLAETNVGTSASDYDPIAADVESFQVSYVMNKGGAAPDSGGDWILGNTTADNSSSKLPIVGTPRPLYDSPYADASRFTADPANVRAVIFELSIRSLRAEGRKGYTQPRLADDPTAAAAADSYYHTSISTTVRTPNMASRSVFIPPLRVAGDPSILNEWGG